MWQASAACKGSDVEQFFPEKGDVLIEIKACCAKCPVKAPCLEYALQYPRLRGYWGGTNEIQRRRMQRKAA
jgi:WhiB family redox-sensing transcriptional regulator